MKKLIAICLVCLTIVVANANANTIKSSMMIFKGTLTYEEGEIYGTGILNMVNKEEEIGLGDGIAGFDIYAKDGSLAWFGDMISGSESWTSQVIASHDAWPTYPIDTPDWYQYSIEFYNDGGTQKWAIRNHAGSTAENPHSTIACGVPMSGTMDWVNGYALETDIGAYLPGTGTPEIAGGAAAHGGGAGAWDMDWSWGSEAVPLEYPGFTVLIMPPIVTSDEGGSYEVVVTLTPAVPEPATITLLTLGGFVLLRRKSA